MVEREKSNIQKCLRNKLKFISAEKTVGQMGLLAQQKRPHHGPKHMQEL